MTAGFTDIEEGKEVCRLTGGGEHGGCAALQLRNFGCYIIAGGILQAGIKISCCF